MGKSVMIIFRRHDKQISPVMSRAVGDYPYTPLIIRIKRLQTDKSGKLEYEKSCSESLRTAFIQ